MFDQLSSLDTSRTTWRIKARVTRMWASTTAAGEEGQNLKGYNLILLDEDNYHLHAFVYPNNWKSVGQDIEEGGVYVISNFYTKEATGNMRPTSSKIIINFSNSTTVQKILSDDFMIPNHKFEFVDLGDLFRLATQNEEEKKQFFSTDVIGAIENFIDVKDIKTMYGDRKIVKFRITDGRYSHMVTVWGDLAVEANESYHKFEEGTTVIAVLTSVKLKTFKEEVQLNTLPASKIYMNLDDDVVTSMKIRLQEEGYTNSAGQNNSTPLPLTPTPVFETITLSMLSGKTSTAEEKRIYVCFVKITKIEPGQKWWYFSCPQCQGELNKTEGRYNCFSCKKFFPVAERRYKFFVLAADSTEAFDFVLLDRAAKRIIGKTASKLLSDNLKLQETEEYPDNIKQLIGREIHFQVEISSDNVLIDSKIFKVINAYDNEMTGPSSSSTFTGFSASNSLEQNAVQLSPTEATPSSSKSVSKKPKMI